MCDDVLLDLRVEWPEEFWLSTNDDGKSQIYCRFCRSFWDNTCDPVVQTEVGAISRRIARLRNHACLERHVSAMKKNPQGRVPVQAGLRVRDLLSRWDSERWAMPGSSNNPSVAPSMADAEMNGEREESEIERQGDSPKRVRFSKELVTSVHF